MLAHASLAAWGLDFVAAPIALDPQPPSPAVLSRGSLHPANYMLGTYEWSLRAPGLLTCVFLLPGASAAVATFADAAAAAVALAAGNFTLGFLCLLRRIPHP